MLNVSDELLRIPRGSVGNPTPWVYQTNFPGTENPLSEGGVWVNGLADGTDWNNIRKTPGKAFATANVSDTEPERYADNLAHLNLAFNANQYAQGVVFLAGGYTPGNTHEIELLLRFQITAGVARGYETLWNADGHIAVVRWNGDLGDFTVINEGPDISPPVDGDTLRMEITGGIIRVYRNTGLVVTVAEDLTWATGKPGIGFWPTSAATLANYGWKSFEAGNL
ncbi:MAG TPA: hypothetical protein VJT81_06650 [Burkholderiales bacterium]|nr:hypothetical protein [Burkholderiales bacterium]